MVVLKKREELKKNVSVIRLSEQGKSADRNHVETGRRGTQRSQGDIYSNKIINRGELKHYLTFYSCKTNHNLIKH